METVNNKKVKFVCRRCSYNTLMYKTQIKHFKKGCEKSLPACIYSDDQLLAMSFIPIKHDMSELNEMYFDINEDMVQHLAKSDIIYEKYLNEYLECIDKTTEKNKKCKLCDKEFETLNDLRSHIILNCFRDTKIKNGEIIVLKNIFNEDIEQINEESQMNENHCEGEVENGDENEQPKHKIEYTIPFDDDWDISHISQDRKFAILFNKSMYTLLLDEILQNKNNLNVIIDKSAVYSLVFKNMIEKYVEIKTKEVINITMDKLNTHLLMMNEELKDLISEELYIYNKKTIIGHLFSYKLCQDDEDDEEEKMKLRERKPYTTTFSSSNNNTNTNTKINFTIKHSY